jgi:monofunctional glycosyltransferase
VNGSRHVRKFALLTAAVLLLVAGRIGVSLLLLPSVRPLADPRRSLVITVRDWNHRDHPFVVGPRNPHWTPISAVPASLVKAVIAAEDANFYVHEGVDFEAIREAIREDLRRGKFVRGGSTITQQVAKNIFLSRERTISRKIQEFVLARRIDDLLSKSRILELYLNVAELGPMVYGVGHASSYYFGKGPSALTLRESAFLVAMLPGPRVYNPYRNLDRVLRRSERILRRMFAARMISEAEYRAALAEEPNIEGLTRKVEKTIAGPPPEEPLPVPAEPSPDEMPASDIPAPAADPEEAGPPPEDGPQNSLPALQGAPREGNGPREPSAQ